MKHWVLLPRRRFVIHVTRCHFTIFRNSGLKHSLKKRTFFKAYKNNTTTPCNIGSLYLKSWGREIIKETGIEILFPSSVVSLEELKEIIIIRPYSKHNHLNDNINSMMPYLMERAKEIAVIEKAKHESMLEESRKQ